MKARAVVEFADLGEAAAWLMCYCRPYDEGQRMVADAIGHDGERRDLGGVESTAVAQAAVAKLAAYFGLEVGARPPGWSK